MSDDVLHNQCVQDMEEDQVMVVAEEDQVMVVAEEDQVMVVADIVEMDLLEINTKEEEVYAHHTVDKAATLRRNGNLTLKDKDWLRSVIKNACRICFTKL
jgi:hypothetical protein